MFFGAGVLASLFSASSESMLLNVQCSGVPAAVSLDQIVSDVIQDVQVVGDVQSTDDSIHSVTIECVGCDDLKYHQVLSWQGMVAFDVFQRTGILPTCNIHLQNYLPAARLGAPAPVADMPVELEVECKGLKESELSMKALAFSSGALKEAYNQVHLKTDNGDAALSGLHFDHVERRKAAILGLESDEDMLTYNKNDPRAHPKNKGRFETPKPSAYFYIGGWGCRLCPPDDDVMLGLGDSGVALTAWENAYAKALRDSPFPEFSGVQKCDINMHAAKPSTTTLSNESVNVAQLALDAHLALLTSEVDSTEDIDGMPVEVAFDCKAVDEANLSLKALAYAGHALQEAYNQVHLKTDNGDAALSGLHFDHVERRKAAILGLESDEDMLTYNKNDPRAHPKNKGRFETPKPSAYFYIGGWGCRLCPPDDDVMLGLGDSGVALTAWENAYAKALRDSPFPEFSGVQKCDINMHAAKPSTTTLSNESVNVAQLALDAHLALLTSEVDSTEDIDGMPVEVAFDCKAVDEANLSLKALAYAGHALQEAYNQVHLKTDNGDAALSGLHFDHVERRKAAILGLESDEDMLTYNKNDPRAHPKNKGRFETPKPSAYFYIGGWGCRLCPPDDDVMLGLGDSGAALHAWENTFTAALQEGPFPEFKSANSCEITMKATHGSASVAATA